MMRQETLSRALALAGTLDAVQRARLELLCAATISALETQLREGLTPEDCRESFLTAACLQALAAMEDYGDISEFKAGDLTVKKGTQAGKLREQAQALMGPYLKDRFVFAGV